MPPTPTNVFSKKTPACTVCRDTGWTWAEIEGMGGRRGHAWVRCNCAWMKEVWAAAGTTCPRCKGTGAWEIPTAFPGIAAGMVECPECKGMGWHPRPGTFGYSEWLQEVFGHGIDPAAVFTRCPVCGGSGGTITQVCWRCDGKRVIPPDPPQVQCPDCRGFGFHACPGTGGNRPEDRFRCSRCNGSGKVNPPPKPTLEWVGNHYRRVEHLTAGRQMWEWLGRVVEARCLDTHLPPVVVWLAYWREEVLSVWHDREKAMKAVELGPDGGRIDN